ncbi:MAG: toxin, partial [Cytophagales bacterium]|nr:toxin [Cytophagales bacterium]
MYPIVTFRSKQTQTCECNKLGNITYGNGAHTTYKYDEKTFRLTKLRTTRDLGTSALQDLNYIYDPAGNIVEMFHDTTDPDLPYSDTEYFNNAAVTPDTKYEYDPLYRLTHATGRQMVSLSMSTNADAAIQTTMPDPTALEQYTQKYLYDELGNILSMQNLANSGNWTRHYHYGFNTGGTDNNYLLGNTTDDNYTTPDFTYDAHGNMTSMPHLASMSWDYADRLQSADLGGGGDVYYTYDAGGDRVRKVIENGNIVEERIYLGDYEVYRKTTNGTLDTERETLHISDDSGRIALVDTLTVDAQNPIPSPQNLIKYQLSNHLGTATLELDSSASILSYEEYHPFGSTSYRSGSSAAEVSLKRYRYVGKERDDETGLYYYGARYYAAWLARFVSVDPLKDDYPYYTCYQYAGNKPITFIDLDGWRVGI